MDWKKYLFLKEMITPKLLDIFYWIASVFIIIASIVTLFQNFMMGILGLVFGLLLVRIQFEFIYVIFGIYRNTKVIASNYTDLSNANSVTEKSVQSQSDSDTFVS